MSERPKSNARATDNQDPHDQSPFGDPGDEPQISGGPLGHFGAPHFRCLGVDGPTYFVQPRRVPDIVDLSARSMTLANFIRLAPLQWWQIEFPAKSGKEGGVDLPAAINALIASCLARGPFDSSSAVGRGATMDGGHVVFHAGDRLFVDGREQQDLILTDAKHAFLPRPALSLPAIAGSQQQQFEVLGEALAGWRWRDPDSAKLLAGWVAIAVIAGALDQRPHAWIIGGRGSAKTALLRTISSLLGSFVLPFDGSTTEAGIRQMLKGDALPVLIDEAEVRDERSAERVGRLVEMSRSSYSSSGVVAKGSAGGRAVSFSVRSAFAFASIAPSLTAPADRSRFVVLPLTGASTGKDLINSREACESLIANGFGNALIRRSIQLLPAIRLSARTMSNALVEAGHEPRTGDTLGTIAAGWWSLRSDQPISIRDARLVVESWLGKVVTLNRAPNDAEMAWEYLLTRRIAVTSSTETTIAQLINPDQDEPHGAVKALALRGFKLGEEDGRRCLLVATGVDGVKEHFRGSPWAATWPSVLMGLPEAQKTDRGVRFQGHKSRYISIPVDP